MKVNAKQQASMTNHHVMMLAPTEVREKCFEDVYALNLLETENHCLEEEAKQVVQMARGVEAEVKSKELEVKRRELELSYGPQPLPN